MTVIVTMTCIKIALKLQSSIDVTNLKALNVHLWRIKFQASFHWTTSKESGYTRSWTQNQKVVFAQTIHFTTIFDKAFFCKGIWFDRFLISPWFLLKIMKPFVSFCCFIIYAALFEVSWKFMWSSNSYSIHVCVSLCPRHLLCGDRYKLIRSDQSDQAADCFLSWATYFITKPRDKIARFGTIILIILDMNIVEI